MAITRAEENGSVMSLAKELMTDQGLVAHCYQWHPVQDLLVYIKEKNLCLVESEKMFVALKRLKRPGTV